MTPLVLSTVLVSIACVVPHGESEPAPRAERAAAEVRAYDLSTLRPRYDAAPQAELLSPSLPWLIDGLEQEGAGYGGFEPGQVLELLAEVLGEEAQYEGRFLELFEGDQMLVGGPPEMQARVEELLVWLKRVYGARRALRVDVVKLPVAGGEPPAAGVRQPAEVDAWLAGLDRSRAGVRRFDLSLSSGRTAAVDASRELGFVFDYDVEVAAGSFMHDPVFAVARVGTRLLVRGSAGKGGTYLALALKESALAGEPSTRRLGLGGILGAEGGQRSTSLETDAVVQDLRLRKHALTANAWLPDGQVLVLRSSVDVARGGEHLVVALRRADGGGDDALEELRTGGRRVTAVDLDRASPPAFAPHVEAEAWTGPLPSDLVVSHARAASSDSPLYLAARLVEPYEPGLLGLLADRLTMSDVKVLQQGPRWFFLGPESVQTADLASVQPPAPDATLLEVELFDASGRVVQSLALPTRVGTWSLAALGTESLECFDHDVEVAQYAGASDPVAHTVLDGALLALLPTRGPDGELRVEARVRAHVRNAERREADLQGMLSLKVDELDFDHLIADEELVLAGPESRVVLGDASGGSAGVRRGLSLVVRAR